MGNLQTAVRLRPVDLAREHGLSTQAVRNYEDAGILPRAERTAAGYRVYTPRHAQALRAFLALVPGHGHATAAAILRCVHDGDEASALRLVDETHAQLLADRRTLRAVEDTLDGLGADAGRTSPQRGETFIGPLAARLRIRPVTLRQWERVGLVRPRRDPATGYRVYDAAAVRDAELTHQLRRGGYLLEQIAPLVEQVRTAGGVEPLAAALDEWHARLTARGRALLSGAAALDAYLSRYAAAPPA
ncbi:TioE family transcriptional regulator [Promicromonospora thailandica]|uniref:DNA-binding transcriptional regulator, MerR family n=1 Tax=Promicromonospora thailandica TaxID=765201 RepID=A0A9X2JWP0_9MICO|nr:TioE family transcriptional regulator [Promicromonospora thailandica]MCP2265368.1 DNA-binding transcriptional regulator, MerR family [Promicromonospora thailandica]BFF16903.1 TioE family transcriptional regulator [Promicromonospora thailandica]